MNGKEFSATDLDVLERQVIAWRRARPGRSRIPKDLWVAAVALAGSEGVSWVARILHLDYYRLKRRRTPGAGDASKTAGLPTFVDVQLAPSIPEPTQRWRIELHDEAASRLMIEMGHEIPALVAVVEAFWKRCRHDNAVYFLSRAKAKMALTWADENPWAHEDPRNHGVLHDQWVLSAEGHRLRLIEYRDPESGREFMFLTNEPNQPPGVLAELYQRRWEVQKVFDEIKNKLGERKAWASSQEARTVQGRCVALTYNLEALYERRIRDEHDIHNSLEDKRRTKRLSTLEEVSEAAGRAMSNLLQTGRDATQRSVKFIRWLRSSLRDQIAEEAAIERLRHLYASL